MNMKKMRYEVTIKARVKVLANSEEEACDDAWTYMRDNEDTWDTTAKEIEVVEEEDE